ncbi:SugE protein [Salmonella enterica subsp. enterica]|uniref:SugE protein n=1 Tax=Salmonella enterica I TaxID=59201 RepID=A0A379WHJ6_SALET|nr:SugE protein [Salmonella enterica subsp. enterica]
MSWIILLIAGLLEVVWAVGLKYTHGFSRLTPSIITITAMVISYGVTFLGNENAARWNGVRHLDRHRRRWGGNHRYPSCWASLPHRRVCSVLA